MQVRRCIDIVWYWIKQKISTWFRDLAKISPDRQVELVIALFVAAFALFQWRTTSSNNNSNTLQTSQLISAGELNARAALDSSQASQNFANSARGINQGVNEAVEKLQSQARYTEELAEEALQQSAATRTLANEAGRQADAGKAQAEASKVIAERTTAQAEATNRLATAAEKSATASAQQLATLQRQLEVSQRAWITITSVKAVVLKTFDEGNGIAINPVITYQNVGNLPAVQIHVEPYMYFANTSTIPLPQAVQNQRETCTRHLPKPNTFQFSISQSAFPTVSREFTYGAGIPKNYSWEVGATGVIEPMLVGCIYYRFSSSDSIHETGFIYQVKRKMPNGDLVDLKFGEDVPVDQVVFADYWNGEAVSDNP